MRIAFYVSGRAGRIRKLLELNRESVFQSTVFVLCDNLQNKDLHALLKGENCEYIEFDYNILADTNKARNIVLSDIILDKLTLNNIDYLFCFGEHILKGNLLQKYHNKIINFHPAILPLYPGLRAIDQGRSANAFLYGNTAHFIDSGIDTGPIIMQNVVHRDFFEKYGYDGILDQQVNMLEQIVKWLEADRIQVKENVVTIRDLEANDSVFFPQIEKE